MNHREGFRRLCVVLSVAVLLTALTVGYYSHSHPFLKEFRYTGSFGYGAGPAWVTSPEWQELETRVVEAADAGYLSEDQANAILDNALSPELRQSDNVARAVGVVIVDLQASYDSASRKVAFDRIAFRPATYADGQSIAANSAATSDSQPIDGLGPLIEARFTGRPLPPDFETMEPETRRDLIQALHVQDALEDLKLPDHPIVPLYQRIDGRPFRGAAILIAMLWFLYGASVYVARGFYQSAVSPRDTAAPGRRRGSKTSALSWPPFIAPARGRTR
jgi:hypothetical protein